MKDVDPIQLLKAYRQLWVNRQLPVENNEYDTLLASIEKELKDEMTHPRIRKSPDEKFYLSVKRIISSTIHDHQKVKLIDLHINVFETLKNKGL